MTWIEVVWPMLSAASLTLAWIHLVIWIQRRNQLVHLLFAIAATSMGGIAMLELMEFRATTTAAFAAAIRWAHPLLAVFMIAVIGIVRAQFCAGRLWLAWTIAGMRLAALLPNFLTGVNLNFQSVRALEFIEIWGSGPLAIGVVEPNPWMLLGQLSNLLMVAFLVDAMVTVWRRGDQHQRRAAMLVAGSFALALLVAGVTTAAIGLGWLRLPMALNPMFLPALLAMSYQLGSEVVRAGILSERMSRKEAEITHLARVATIGELTGSLAHELTQPLTAIMSNAQAALGLVASGQHGSADMRQCLIAILEGDKRAIEVIRRLRRMLKKQEIELQALDLNELVQDALELARSDLTSRGVRIGVELATRLPAVRGDRVQLQQVLLNLLLNACDAMQGMADEPQLNVCTRAGTAGNVELAVGDNGPGIAPDQLDRIFEPFVSTRRDGLGLGLTVARTIVSGHHGAIHAHNQSAGGACLVVTLPCEQSMNK